MDFLSGLTNVATGFGNQSRVIRQQEQEQANKQWELERRTLEYLATSSDPDIRAAAITGILDTSQMKPGKGLSGWFGQVQSHPAFENIKQILATPVMREHTEQVDNPEGGVPIYNASAGLGRLVGSPETGGGGAGSVGAPGQLPGAWTPGAQPQPTGRTPTSTIASTTMRPEKRQAFGTPGEEAGAYLGGQVSGRLDAMIKTAQAHGITVTPEMISSWLDSWSGTPHKRGVFKQMMVTFRDGRQPGMVSYNTETGEAYDADGNDVSGNILGLQAKPSSSGAGKKFIQHPDGSWWQIVPDPNSPGQNKQIPSGEGTPPPDALIVTSDGQVVSAPHRTAPGATPATPQPLPGVRVPPKGGGTGTTPGERAGTRNIQVMQEKIKEVRAHAEAAAKLPGGMNSKRRYQQALEEGAIQAGYKSYADMQRAYDDAVKTANTVPAPGGATVAPPPGPPPDATPGAAVPPTGAAPPQFGSKEGADRIRQYLPGGGR